VEQLLIVLKKLQEDRADTVSRICLGSYVYGELPRGYYTDIGNLAGLDHAIAVVQWRLDKLKKGNDDGDDTWATALT